MTVDDDRLADIDSVADDLRAAGLTVDQVLGAVGIITGSAPADKRRSVERVAGVVAVEDENTFQLPPPDAEIQ